MASSSVTKNEISYKKPKREKEDELLLLSGRPKKISETIYIKHPTINDILDINTKYGNGAYESFISVLGSTSVDIADILWVEANVWYSTITDEFKFFIERFVETSSPVFVKHINDGKLLSILETYTLYKTANDALNFFLGTDDYYIILEHKDSNQFMLLNAKKDEKDSLYIDENSISINGLIYSKIVDFVKDIFNINSDDYAFLNAGTKKVARDTLERMYKKRNKKKPFGDKFTLSSIISGLIAENGNSKDVFDYPIYLVYDHNKYGPLVA